jgi:transcriptional regulator with XRE-family HTH domain
MSSIIERIAELAQNEGITITSLERKIGASNRVLSRALSKGTDIHAKWLQVIADIYPLYSESWLLTGRGSMLKQEPVSPLIDEKVPNAEKLEEENKRLRQMTDTIIKTLKQLNEIREENQELRKEIKILRNELNPQKNFPSRDSSFQIEEYHI